MVNSYDTGKQHGLIEKNVMTKEKVKARIKSLEDSIESCKVASSKDYIRGLLAGLR